MSLTSIVLTKNNQETISSVLSLLSFSDELIVVDDFSSDDTVKVAKQLNAKVFHHSLNNNWAEQRNFALSKATSDWVLFVDSDEIVSVPLKQEILKAISQSRYSAFYLHRTDVLYGHPLYHGETGNIKLLRLSKRSQGSMKASWKASVHETWEIKGRTTTLKHPLLHIRRLKLTDFLTRINYYTDLQAAKQKHFNYLDLLKPLLKFLYNYIFLLGFLDGFAGLVIAYYMSIHSLSVRIKTWENSHS